MQAKAFSWQAQPAGSAMPLAYHPRPGDILLCHFPECFVVPEMVKCRPVVVVSKRLPGRDGLACVVPLSSTAPQLLMRYHMELPIRCMPAVLQAKSSRVWIKCDMIYTLGQVRLDRFH